MRVSARPEAAPYRTRRGGACLPERNAAPPGVVTLCLPECRVGSPGVPALASGRCRGSAPGESADPSGRPESRIGAPRKSGPLSRGGLLRGGCEFGIIRDMTNHAKSLAVWALAVAGAMAAPLRSEASEHKVSTPPPNCRKAAWRPPVRGLARRKQAHHLAIRSLASAGGHDSVSPFHMRGAKQCEERKNPWRQ